METKRYKVHFFEQDVIVDATEEAEAEFLARDEVECDAIGEVF
jgi:hypothetical protein